MARRWGFLRVVFGRGELKPGGDMGNVRIGRSWKPDRKVGHAVAIGTPAGTIIAWAIESGVGWDVPTFVATAFGGLVTGLWAYFTRDSK